MPECLKTFDPNAACKTNGRFFGFPYTEEEADLILLPVPWDVTTSYQAGTADGPMAILKASYQLDFFDFYVPKAWEKKIGTTQADFSQIREASKKMRHLAIKRIEAGEEASKDSYEMEKIEAACSVLNEWVEEQCSLWLQKGKKIGLVGGDHSVPLGYYKALSSLYPSWGILHIDAHADLRQAYEGFTYSHASIMYNALALDSAMAPNPAIETLVQVGIRDVCEEEMQRAAEDHRIQLFPDVSLRAALCEGQSWAQLCLEILNALPQRVYVSLDIDGLDPALCPHTGTPVPGGLSFGEVRYLLEALRRSGKEIIGFDLCEVAPHPSNHQDEWDGNVGARLLYQLCLSCLA